MRLAFAALLCFALAACAPQEGPGALPGAITAAAAQPPAPVIVGKSVQTRIVNASGAQVGFANFREGPQGVVILLEFNPKALTPGWHGAHLHQKGDCADFAAGFQASGAHLGHGGASGRHGLLNPSGPEAGDLANIFVADTDGPFGAELYSSMVTLDNAARGGRMPLLGPEGAALVIHANGDDHKSQPIGGAGARVACAALKG